jgi:hypothetical protein
VGAARALYERFTATPVRKLFGIGIRYGTRWLTRKGKLNIEIPEQLAVIGRISAIEYDTTYNREYTEARHRFAPSARPWLAVGTGRGQAFIIGPDFKFTDRGFIDFDRSGRAIEFHEKTGKVTFLRD